MKESTINGRVAVYQPNHPAANNRGYILRSRYVVEQKLGRHLLSTEIVHHKNSNEFDDSWDNLEITSHSAHTSNHWRDGTFVGKLNDKQLLALREKGLGYKRIAKIMGHPRSSVRDALKRLGGVMVSTEEQR